MHSGGQSVASNNEYLDLFVQCIHKETDSSVQTKHWPTHNVDTLQRRSIKHKSTP